MAGLSCFAKEEENEKKVTKEKLQLIKSVYRLLLMKSEKKGKATADEIR